MADFMVDRNLVDSRFESMFRQLSTEKFVVQERINRVKKKCASNGKLDLLELPETETENTKLKSKLNCDTKVEKENDLCNKNEDSLDSSTPESTRSGESLTAEEPVIITGGSGDVLNAKENQVMNHEVENRELELKDELKQEPNLETEMKEGNSNSNKLTEEEWKLLKLVAPELVELVENFESGQQSSETSPENYVKERAKMEAIICEGWVGADAAMHLRSRRGRGKKNDNTHITNTFLCALESNWDSKPSSSSSSSSSCSSLQKKEKKNKSKKERKEKEKVQGPKRGRGRPRLHPPDNKKQQQTDGPRKRGRPRKLALKAFSEGEVIPNDWKFPQDELNINMLSKYHKNIPNHAKRYYKQFFELEKQIKDNHDSQQDQPAKKRKIKLSNIDKVDVAEFKFQDLWAFIRENEVEAFKEKVEKNDPTSIIDGVILEALNEEEEGGGGETNIEIKSTTDSKTTGLKEKQDDHKNTEIVNGKENDYKQQQQQRTWNKNKKIKKEKKRPVYETLNGKILTIKDKLKRRLKELQKKVTELENIKLVENNIAEDDEIDVFEQLDSNDVTVLKDVTVPFLNLPAPSKNSLPFLRETENYHLRTKIFIEELRLKRYNDWKLYHDQLVEAKERLDHEDTKEDLDASNDHENEDHDEFKNVVDSASEETMPILVKSSILSSSSSSSSSNSKSNGSGFSKLNKNRKYYGYNSSKSYRSMLSGDPFTATYMM